MWVSCSKDTFPVRASLPRAQFPPGEGGGGWISVHLLEGAGAAPTPSPCPGSGARGLGGRSGASEGGGWAGVGAEWRPEAPQLPPASPSSAWQDLELWVHELESPGRCSPRAARSGRKREDTAMQRQLPRSSGSQPRGRGKADQRGWGTFQEPGSQSARANIQPVFFYGVQGGRVSELHSQRSGMMPNEAEVRGQVRARMSRVGDL